jgi:hypothetical protein
MAEVSRRIVEQRVRNNLIEYFELVGSFEQQEQYERNVPIAYVPFEVIEQWHDSVPSDPRSDPGISKVYSPAEVEAMQVFQPAWEKASAAIPDRYPVPPLPQVFALPEWIELRDAAQIASKVFRVRGKMPDDREVP